MKLPSLAEILHRYRGYINPGTRTVEPDGNVSENGWRFTAEHLWVLKKYNLLNSQQIALYIQVYSQGLRAPGLYMKAPKGYLDHQNSVDNHVAFALASSLIDPEIARRIIIYGKSTFPRYVYNNVVPGKFTGSAWIGRQPWIITTLKWAAGMKPWFFGRLIWCGNLYFSTKGDQSHQDKWVLAWMLIKVAGNKGWIERLASRYWIKQFRKSQWNHGIGQVLERYFHGRVCQTRDDKMHPNAYYLWDEFGDS